MSQLRGLWLRSTFINIWWESICGGLTCALNEHRSASGPQRALISLRPCADISIFWPHICFSISSDVAFHSCERKKVKTHNLFYSNRDDFPMSGHNWVLKEKRTLWPFWETRGPYHWVVAVQCCSNMAEEHFRASIVSQLESQHVWVF